MPQSEAFEDIVKRHVDAGADIHTAFGRAIGEDPEGYSRYLVQQGCRPMGDEVPAGAMPHDKVTTDMQARAERIKAAIGRFEAKQRRQGQRQAWGKRGNRIPSKTARLVQKPGDQRESGRLEGM